MKLWELRELPDKKGKNLIKPKFHGQPLSERPLSERNVLCESCRGGFLAQKEPNVQHEHSS